ncbi:hypothetical protein CEUSTIGMA_g4509.t1 [Chlamydomonas eustigma]|uniref:Uncharacterized protein n=1 Tax=Chlamydomonas eustigma TaxID=1157962 RepID=A0A250X1V1_9CHLO|nr:hypothetical protein CEUSTIGMA_g4509.t1 [Chlamydomonas eustigma]|eukprot:GAX77063.1 hypothetical protein CEUSTIGMA_g4509.t1 [Chlamydomonas eustigma]
MDHRTMLLRQYEILASQLQTVALQSGDDSASRKILDGMNNESLSETYIDHLPNNNSRVLKTEASHPSRTRSIWQSVDSELHFSGSPSSILNNSIPNQQHAASLSAGTANRPSNPTPHSYLPTLMEGQFTALQSSKDLVDQNSETYEEQVSQNYNKQKEGVRHSHNYDSEQRHTAELFQRRQYPGLPRPRDPDQVQEGRMCAQNEHQRSSNKNVHPRGAGNGTCSAGTHYSPHHPAQAQHHHPHSSTQSQEVSYSSDHMPEAHSHLNPEHEEGTERGLFQQIDDRTQAAMRLKVQQQVQQNSPLLLPEFVTKLCDEQGTTLLTRHVSLLESGTINQRHLPSSTADCLSVRSDSVSTSNKCQRVCQEDRPDSAHSLSFGANVDENTTSGKLTSEGAQHTSSTTIAGQKGRGSSNDNASRQKLPKLPPFTRRLTSSSSSSSSPSDSHNQNPGTTSDGSNPKLQNPGTTSDGSSPKLQNPGTTSDGSRTVMQLPEREQGAGSSGDDSSRNKQDGRASCMRCRSEETCSASDKSSSSSRCHAMSRRYASSSDPHYDDQQQADSPSSADPENNSGSGRSSSRQDSLFLSDRSRHRRSFKSSRKLPNSGRQDRTVADTTNSRPAISEASSSMVSGQAIMNTTRMAQNHEDRVDHTHQAAPAASPPYLNTSAQNNDVNKRPAAGKQAISKSPARHLKPAGRSIDDIDMLDQLQRATIRLEWMDDRRQPLLLPLNIVLQDKQEAGLRAEHSSLYRCLDVLPPPPPLQRNSMQHKRREAETTALFSPPRDQATALYDVSAGLLAGMKSDTVLQKGDNDHRRKQPAAVISHARSEYRRKPGYEETGSEQDNGSALQRHDSSWRGSRGARVPAKVQSMQETPRRGSALKLFDASGCVGNPTSSATAEASSSAGSIMPGFMKTTSHRFKESADFLLKTHALQKIAMDQKWSSQQAALRRRGQSVNQVSSTMMLSHQHHLNIDETYIGGLEKQSSIENLSQQALLVQDLNKIKQDYPSCSNEKLDTSSIHNHRSSLRSSLDDASTSTSESDVAQWVSRASRHAQLLPLMTSDSEEEETDTGRRALLKQAYERARAEVIGSHALAADGEEKREEDSVQLQWHQIPEDISGIRGSIIRNKHRVLLNTREDLLNEKQQQPEVVHETSLQIKRESKSLLEDIRNGHGMMTEVTKNSHKDMTSKHSRHSRHPNMTPNEQHDGHRSCSPSRQQQDPDLRLSSQRQQQFPEQRRSSSRQGGHCTPDRGCGGGRQLRNLTPEYGRAGRRLKLTTIPQGHRGRMRHEETLLPEHSRFSSSSTRRPLTPGPYSRQYNSDKRPSPPSAGVMTRSRSCMRSHDLSKRSYYEGPEIAVACPRRNYIATDSIAKAAESMELFTAGGHGCPTRENSGLLVPSVMQNDRASQGAPEIITVAPAGNDHGVIIQQREAVLAPILDQLRVLLQSLETKLSVSDIQKDSASTQEPISTSTPRSRPLHATTEIIEDPMHGMGMVADAAWSPLTMNRNHSSTSATSAASAAFTSTVTHTLSHGSAAVSSATNNRLSSGGSAAAAVTSATNNRLSSGGSAAAAALAAATTLEHMLSATLSSLPPPATAGPANSGTNSGATSSAGSAVVSNDTLVRLAEAGKQVEAMTAILNQLTANRVPHAPPVTE